MNIFENDGDNRVLECAVESESKYIISVDKKHLLKLKKYKGIIIIPPFESYKGQIFK